jgi:hypothetical protein
MCKYNSSNGTRMWPVTSVGVGHAAVQYLKYCLLMSCICTEPSQAFTYPARIMSVNHPSLLILAALAVAAGLMICVSAWLLAKAQLQIPMTHHPSFSN